MTDAASMEDLDAAEDEIVGSAPESPLKLQRKESTSSSSDLASPGEKIILNNTVIGSNLPTTNMTHLTSAVNQANFQPQMVIY
jgi:hypothetical protein